VARRRRGGGGGGGGGGPGRPEADAGARHRLRRQQVDVAAELGAQRGGGAVRLERLGEPPSEVRRAVRAQREHHRVGELAERVLLHRLDHALGDGRRELARPPLHRLEREDRERRQLVPQRVAERRRRGGGREGEHFFRRST